MEQKKPISHIAAGLIIAGISIIFAITINFLGLTQQKSLGFIQYAIIVLGLIYFVNQHGKAFNYQKSFGDLFAFGFKATAVLTSIYIIFIVLFFLIFPDMKEKSLEMARQNMESGNTRFSEDQIDQGIAMTKKFFWVGLVGGTLLIFVIIGAIGSLLGAAFTPKRPLNPFEQPLP